MSRFLDSRRSVRALGQATPHLWEDLRPLLHQRTGETVTPSCPELLLALHFILWAPSSPPFLSHRVAHIRSNGQETEESSICRGSSLFRPGGCSAPLILVSVCSLALWPGPASDSRRREARLPAAPGPSALGPPRNKAQQTLLLSPGWQGNLN